MPLFSRHQLTPPQGGAEWGGKDRPIFLASAAYRANVHPNPTTWVPDAQNASPSAFSESCRSFVTVVVPENGPASGGRRGPTQKPQPRNHTPMASSICNGSAVLPLRLIYRPNWPSPNPLRDHLEAEPVIARYLKGQLWFSSMDNATPEARTGSRLSEAWALSTSAALSAQSLGFLELALELSDQTELNDGHNKDCCWLKGLGPVIHHVPG